MTPRPLPKTVAPLPDELLSGWLARLAAANYCEVGELLAHVEIDARHAVTLDFELEAGAAERIAAAARVDPETVQPLTFLELTQSEALPTAQIPFQSCALCAKRGIALKHWRRVCSFGCQLCGTTLLPILAKPVAPMSEKLLRRARTGAELLEQAAWSSSSAYLRRAKRAVTFAMALKNVRGDPAFALQSPMPTVRFFCLAAIAAAQTRPLLKAAMCTAGADGFARVALLRAYEKEPRLLAAVDRIAARTARSAGTLSHN